MTTVVGRVFRGRFISGMKPKEAPPVFLLTTVGRKSGKPRTVALSQMTDEEGVPITVGTYGGLPTEPAWVLNLRDNPDAVMQTRNEKTPIRAEFLEGDEWTSMWERILDNYPLYEDPLSTAERHIPIIRLNTSSPNQHPPDS